MPHQPSWLLRVNEILEDLSGPELSPIPFLSRAAIESLFRLRRRQAIHLMHAVGGFQVGKAFVVARSDLLRWLRRASLGEQVWWEQARHARVEHAIEQVRHERQARKLRTVIHAFPTRPQAREPPHRRFHHPLLRPFWASSLLQLPQLSS